MSDLVVAHIIAAWLECFPEKPVGVGMNRSAREGKKCKAL